MGNSVVKCKCTPIPFKWRDLDLVPPEEFESVEFSPSPFDEGSHRYAFKGTIIPKKSLSPDESDESDESDGDVTCGLGLASCIGWRKRSGGYPCVVKKFKKANAMFSNYWSKDVHLLLECQRLADKYNEELSAFEAEQPVCCPRGHNLTGLDPRSMLNCVACGDSGNQTGGIRSCPACAFHMCQLCFEYNWDHQELYVRFESRINFATPVLAEVAVVGHEEESFSKGGGSSGGIAGCVVGTGARFLAVEAATAGGMGLAAAGGVGLVAGATLTGIMMAKGKTSSACIEKERVCIEPYLNGHFRKLNSNSGWVDESRMADVGQAFSHWTWAHTDGEMLVCDLQGTYNKSTKKWLLTDPAAHSDNPSKLGKSDLGPKGADAFFAKHRCNAFCRTLPKKKPEPGAPLPFVGRKRTSFSWEVITCNGDPADRVVSANVHKQSGGTCYAHAVATVVRSAECRIMGRKREEHSSMLKRIVAKHGTNGGSVEKVLSEECPPKRLHWKQVNSDDAIAAVRCGRPVIYGFWLSDDQWSQFSEFFAQCPSETLQKGTIKQDAQTKKGHAVAIKAQNHGRWEIKNSWGVNFANNGCYMMECDALPAGTHETFWDVFWYEHELSREEKRAWESSGAPGLSSIDE